MPLISVVSPVYGCRDSLNELYSRLSKTLSSITEDYEIIFVNDSSPDNAWEVINELAQKDSRVKGINLAKNFGQHKAISVGIDYSKGNWVVVMDCDLQDRPEEIVKLYNKALEGYEVVFGKRANRKDSIKKKFSSKIFLKIYDYLTDTKTDESIGNFSIISRKVANNLSKLKEQHKPYSFAVIWLGFKRTSINVEHAQREIGTSSYTLRKLFSLAGDNIIYQSNKPLKIFISIGFIFSAFSFIYGIYLILKYFITEEIVPGWTSVMVSIWFVGGLLLFSLGVIGIYIGKIFDEVKNRPNYIIDNIIDNKDR